MTPPDLASIAADIAAVRELVADVADIVRGAKRAGYLEGRGEWDDRQADANAREARAGFKVVPPRR